MRLPGTGPFSIEFCSKDRQPGPAKGFKQIQFGKMCFAFQHFGDMILALSTADANFRLEAFKHGLDGPNFTPQ